MRKHWAGALLILFACQTNAAPLNVSFPDIIPLSFITPEGQNLGLYVDLMNAIGHEAGLELRLQITPFARSVNLIKQNKIDLAVHNLKVVQSSRLHTIGLLHTTDLVLWPNSNLQLKTKSQLNGQIVGRLRGGCQNVLDQQKVKFYDVNNYDQGVKMLAAQRIDVLCGSREAILFAIRRNALSALESQRTLLLEPMKIVLLARKDLAESDRMRLQQAMHKVMNSGLPQQLASRYGLH